MPNQATGGAIWTDTIGGGQAAVGARRGIIVRVAPSRYEIRDFGIAGASLVARSYGYEIVVSDLTGTGVIAVIGDDAVIY